MRRTSDGLRLHIVRLSRLLTYLTLVTAAATEILAASGPEIRGRLLDTDGGAVSGARVELVTLPDRSETGRLQLAGQFPPAPTSAELSHDDGTFTVTAPAPGIWRLQVRSEAARLPAELVLRPLVESQDVGDVELMDGFRQGLVVLDSDARPVGGLRLRVQQRLLERRSTGPFSWLIARQTVETSAAGHATLLRAAGSEAWVAAVMGDRYVYGRLGPGRDAVTLQLEPLRRARIVDAEGRAVAGAVGSFLLPSLAFGHTGPEGGVLVPHQNEDGPGLFFATAEGGVEGHVDGVDGSELLVRLGSTVAADGQVIDAFSGRAIDGAFVWAWHTYRETGRDGRFRLRLAVSDLLRVSAAGYEPDVVRRKQIAAGGLTVDLLPVVSREGWIVDVDGEGIEGAEIRAGADLAELPASGSRPDRTRRLLSLTVQSDAEGRFRLPRMAPSVAYELEVRRSGYVPSRVVSPPIEPGRTMDGLRIVLRPASRVLGRVLDADRQAVADAAVGIVPPGVLRRISSRFARTDSEGRFALLDLAAGTYRFAAEAPGLAYRVLPGVEIPDDGSDVDLGAIVLSPAASLGGRVVDREGAAVAGARVHATLSRWPLLGRDASSREGETDAEGRFRLVELSPSDEAKLVVEKVGYRKLEIPGLQIEGAEPLELVLLPGLELRGRVIDGVERPVAEATVTLTRWSDSTGRSSETVTADADGSFVFDSQAPGRFELLGRSKDGLAGFHEGELKQGRQEVKLVLRSALTVSGRLLDPDGLGVSYGRIALEPYQPGEVDALNSRTKRVDVSSATDGSFTIAGIVPGSYRLSARHAEHAPLIEILELSADASDPLELRFTDRLLKIHGRVIDDSGHGVADATVRYYEGKVFTGGMNPGDARSTAEGEFELRIVRPGPHTLWISHPAFARKFVELEITDDGVPVLIELDRGVVLTGHLLGLEQHQTQRVEVRASSTEGPPTMIGTVDSEGRYRILGLRPGEWTIWASLPQSTRTARESISVSGFDGELVLDLEFPAGHRLSGLVLLDGRPLSTADVVLHCPRARELATRTDVDGSFSFEGVPAGNCRVEVRDRMSQVTSGQKPVEVTGDQELVMEVRTTELAGTVVRASDHEPVAGAKVELLDPGRYDIRRSATTDVLGGFSFPVAAGEAGLLKVTARGYAVAVESVPASGAGELQILLHPAVPVVLKTLTDDGEVPHRVWVAARLWTGSTLFVAQGTYQPDREGRILIDNLGVGRWALRLRDEYGRRARVDLEAPGTVDHEVVLEFKDQH